MHLYCSPMCRYHNWYYELNNPIGVGDTLCNCEKKRVIFFLQLFLSVISRIQFFSSFFLHRQPTYGCGVCVIIRRWKNDMQHEQYYLFAPNRREKRSNCTLQLPTSFQHHTAFLVNFFQLATSVENEEMVKIEKNKCDWFRLQNNVRIPCTTITRSSRRQFWFSSSPRQYFSYDYVCGHTFSICARARSLIAIQ